MGARGVTKLNLVALDEVVEQAKGRGGTGCMIRKQMSKARPYNTPIEEPDGGRSTEMKKNRPLAASSEET
jgi:hypothetical protein